MSRVVNISTGHWYYCERYYISDDGYICPERKPLGKVTEYDPWEGYYSRTKRKRSKDNQHKAGKVVPTFPKYQDLFDLIEDIYPSSGKKQPITTEGRNERIIKWCSENGLLGLLQHKVNELVLTSPYKIKMIGGRPGEKITFIRTPTGWNVNIVKARPGSYEYALVQEIGEKALQEQDLSEGWAKYFPRVPKREAFRYLPPVNSELHEYPEGYESEPMMKYWIWIVCHEYSEPLDEFLRAARLLRDTIHILVKHKNGGYMVSKQELMSAKDMLNRFLTPVGCSPETADDNSAPRRWASPSLLGTLAAMAKEDMDVSGIRICKECRRLFTKKADYCSDTCRFRFEKREYRRRKQRAQELYNKGLTFPQILKRLKNEFDDVRADEATIKKWVKSKK